MTIKDVLSPFIAWKNLFKEPVTIKDPLNRVAAERYRGFHKNDVSTCIGCGTCETICQNAAIDMVPVDGIQTKNGDSGLRPQIDYGRCCWCALCVDICATGSLTMSNVYTWVGSDSDSFRFIPGVDKKPWDDVKAGYKRPENYTLNPLERVHMTELHPHERNNSFIEIVKGFSLEQAIKEADRCVSCGICIATCPAHMGIPRYIEAVRNNNIEEAFKVLYDTNPLPEVCGRVCTHKCETVCAISHRGDPVSIRWLKRYIADQITSDKYKEILDIDVKETGKKVAIIGAGPAGLSAAYYLRLQGHAVTIYEALPEVGGMMRYGIPEYRLPYDQIDKDVKFIEGLGVKFVTNTRIGKDITLPQLNKDFDAVFTATGLHLGRSTRIDGSNHPNVYQAVDLLRDVTNGIDIPHKGNIVVIGGGNVAMDIARTLARLQMRDYGKVSITLTCLETENIMPADREEIVESREEGVILMPGFGPKKIDIESDKIKGLHVVRCLSVFDENKRFNPQFDEADKKVFPADMVVESIGQGMDLSYLPDELKTDLKFDPRGRILVDKTLQSSVPWLFAGGDIIEGPDVIHAIANGHTVAKSIDKYLRGDK